MLRDTPTSFNQYQDTTPKNPFDEEINNDPIQKKKPIQKKNPFDEDLTVKDSTRTQAYKNPFDEDLTKKETISSNPFDEEINEDQDWLNGDGEFPELFNDKNLRTRDYFERAIYENEKIGPVFNAFNAMKQQFTKDLSSTFLEGAAIVTNFVDRKAFEPIVNALGIDYDAPETEDYITWKMAEITTEKIEETFPTNPEFQNLLITQIGTTVGGVGSMIIPGVAQNKLASKALLSVGNTSKAVSKKIAKEIAEDDLIKESISKGSRAAKTTSSGKVLKEAEPIFKNVADIVMNESVTPSSIIGGLQMGVPEFKAAKEAGLSDEEAFETFLLNYTVGNVLERIPIISFLKRFNSKTKGGIVELLKQSTIGGLEETGTETLQTMFANYVASIYYDSDRKMGEGIGEAAGMGFGLGFALNAIGLSGKILNRMDPEVKKAIALELNKEAANGEVNAYSEAFEGYTDEEIVNMSEEEVDEILDTAVEAFRLKYESEEVDGLIEEADRELQGLNKFEDGTPIDKDLSEESKNQSKDVYSELEDKAFKDKTKSQKHVKTFERYRKILEKLEDPVSLSNEERNNLSEELTAIQEGNHDEYLKDKAKKEKEESLKLTQEEKVKKEKERAKVALEESKKEIAEKKKAEEAKAAKKAELEEKKKGLEDRKKELDAKKKKNQESKNKLKPKSKKSVRKGVKDAKDNLLKRADEPDFALDGTEYKLGLRNAYESELSNLRELLGREKRRIANVSESDPDFEEENKEVARIESDIKDLRDAKEEIDLDNIINRLNEEITDDPDIARQLEEDFPEEYKQDPRLASIKDLESGIEFIKENGPIRQKYYEPDLERDQESIKNYERDIEALKIDIEQNPNRYKNNKETSKTEGNNVQSKSNENEVLQRPKSEPVSSDEQVREELDAETEGEVLEDSAKDGDKGVNTPETPTDKSSKKSAKENFNRKKNKQIRDGKEFPPHVANYLIKNKLEPENYVWDEGSSSLVDIEGNLIEVKEPVKREKLTEDEIDQQLIAKEKEENVKLSKELDNKKKELSEESGMSQEAIDSKLKRNTDLSGLTKNSNESIKRKLKELDRLIVDEKDKKEKERIKELGPVGLALDAIEKQSEISSSDKDVKDLNEAKQIANDSKISEDEKIKKLKDLYKRSSKDVKNLVERLEDRISKEYKKTDEYKDRNKKDFKEESEAKKKLKDVEANVVSLSKRIAQKRRVLRTKIIDRLNKENPVFINKEGRKVITDIPEKIIAMEIGKDESLTEDKASLETYIKKYNEARVEAGLKKLTPEQKDILSIQGMTPEKFQKEQEKLMSEFGDLGFEEFSKEGGKTTKGATFNEGTNMSIDEAVDKTKLPPEFSKILKIFNDFIIKKTGIPVEILFSKDAVGKFGDGSPMRGAFTIFNNGKEGVPIKAQIRFSSSKSFAHEIVHSLHLMYKTLDASGQTDSNIDREINAIRTRFKDSLRTAAFSGKLTKGQEMAISNLMKIFGVDSITNLNKAYPFSSNQEFLAHLLTEPDVRYLASTLKDTAPRKGKISTFFNNVFDSLIDLIDKITGGKVSNSYRDSVLKLMSEYESKFIKSFDNDSRFIDRAVYDLEAGLPSLQQGSKEAKVNENFDNADHVRVLMNVTDRYGRYLGKDRFNKLVDGLKKKGYDISSKDKDIAWNHHLAISTGKRNPKILANIRKIIENEKDVSVMKNILIDYLQSSIPKSVKKELLGRLLKPIKAAKDTESLKISIVHLEKSLLDSEFADEVLKLSKFQSRAVKKIDAPLRPLFRKVKEIKPELLSKEELTHLNSLLSDFTKNNRDIDLVTQSYEEILSNYRQMTLDSDPIDSKEKTEEQKEISRLKKLKKRKKSEREVKNYLSKIKNDLSKDKGLIEEMSTEHLDMFASLLEGDLTLLSDSYMQSLKEGLESFYDGGITTVKLMNAAIELRAKNKIADFLVSTKGFKFGDVANWLTSLKNSGQIIATLGKLDKNAVKELGSLIYNDIHHSDAVTQFEKRRIMNDVLQSARGMSQDNFVRIQLYSNIMDTTTRPDMTNPDYLQELEDNIAFFGKAIDNKIESIKNEDGKTQSLKSAEQEKKLFNEIVSDFRESLKNPKKQVLTEAESKLRDHVFAHIADVRPRAKFNAENVWNKEFKESFNYTPTIAQGRAILKGKKQPDFSDPFEDALDNLVEFNDENAVNASQSGTTKKRQRNIKNKEHNLFYDNNFMNVFDNWLGKTLFDINTTQPVKVLSKILKDPEIIKSIGVANVKELKRNLTINLKNARGNYRNYSKPVRIIESIKNTAMVAEMGELKQVANQLLSTMPATYIQNPKGFFKAMKLMSKDMKKVEEFMAIHGQGIQARNILQERFKGSRDYDKTKAQRAVDDAIDQSTKITTYALRKSDELAAKVTFMSAYLELGGTLDNPDPKIIGQAETRTTLLQNISNYNFAPTFMTQKDRRVLTSFMFTFKSFALNQTLNTYTAIRNAGTSGDARKLLLANIANATVFYYLSRFTRELYSEFAEAIGLFGVDYEYEDEEKEEQEYESSLSKGGKASTMIAFDLLLGGGPTQLTSAVEILSDGFYKRRFKGIEDYYGRSYDAYIDNPFFSQKQALPEIFGGYKLAWKAVEAAVSYDTYQLMFGDQIDEDIPNEMHPSRFNIMETLLMTDLMPLPLKGDVIELIRAAERAAKAEVRAIKESN